VNNFLLLLVGMMIDELEFSWKAPWKNRIYWYISFFHPSVNRVLFRMFCLLVEGECQILVSKYY